MRIVAIACRLRPRGCPRTSDTRSPAAVAIPVAQGQANALGFSWSRVVAEQRSLWNHLSRHAYVYLSLLCVYLWALDHIGVNWTPSIPYHVVYIERDASVRRGDLVVFRFEGGEVANHFKGQRFVKRIAGMPGDEITLQGRHVFINDNPVGIARARTRDGTNLEAIEPRVIPAGQFYVQGSHEMSFDSRYRVNGLVRSDQIIGRATAIF